MKLLRCVLFLLSATTLLHSEAVKYSYTGQAFTGFFGGWAGGTSVDGSFETTTPLTDSSESIFTPLRFSFSNGLQTLSLSSPQIKDSFEVFTNASGSPVGWFIYLSSMTGNSGFGGSGTQGAIMLVNLPSMNEKGDLASFIAWTPDSEFDSGAFNDEAGAWNTKLIAPEPSTLALFGPALLLFRRFYR